MISFILLAVSLLPSQSANTTCVNTGPITATTQTQPVQGPDGASALLKVSTTDDHSKNSHECNADYQLLITPPSGGEPTFIDVDTVNGSYGREMSFRIDGFSRDGKHIFGVLAEGGKWPLALLFDYDAVTLASDEPYHLKKLVLHMHWDGEATPSVETPLGDFFGVGPRQPCRCSHAKTIHYPRSGSHSSRTYFPCRYPGCRCKDYKPAKQSA